MNYIKTHSVYRITRYITLNSFNHNTLYLHTLNHITQQYLKYNDQYLYSGCMSVYR